MPKGKRKIESVGVRGVAKGGGGVKRERTRGRGTRGVTFKLPKGFPT
jgi:hypothetical protein